LSIDSKLTDAATDVDDDDFESNSSSRFLSFKRDFFEVVGCLQNV